MDYKNKYNEALERARELSKTITGANYEYIFPELKESKSERIKKVLVDYFKRYKGQEERGGSTMFCGIPTDDIISWFEKQGKNNMGISETTRQKLEDNLNKALEKETPESWNEFLDKQGKQNELNLVEILKHYPRETELYSPLYGKLWLAEVDEENEIITCYKYPLNDGCTRAILEQENTISFYSNGTTGLPDCTISKDCMLFLYNKPESETDFKVGEWVVSPNGVYWHIDRIYNNRYEVTSNTGASTDWPLNTKLYHRFTIQDAEDGDVLTWDDSKCIALFKNIYDDESFISYGFVGHCTNKFETRISYHDIEGVHPATKEQCGLLFQKMKEAGYEWDNEKKQVITLNHFVDNNDMVEPKFHVGDWIASFDYFEPVQVVGIRTREYELSSGMIDPIYMVDNNPNLRLWTIDNIKDGDVLATEPIEGHYSPFVAICKERGLDSFNSHCFIGFDGKFYEGEEGHTIEGIHPATKEQRDLLFEKMEEAGYMWDSKNKELQEIEQSPINMVEPKFKDGDWIVYKDDVWKVCNISLQNYYELLKINNEVSTRLIKDVDENAHLWTINDAKPGDIIYAESKFKTFDFIAIFSEIKNKNSWEYCSVDSDSDDYSDDLDHWEFDDHKGFVALDRYNFYPATKKQRHLLYQKMKDAGYEWDTEKKELKEL